ncbi:uncharacterized protein BJ171DRAFT_221856 [Polychytrium aggregatum]|uniref:uncharacterized protein n=1 Tax=Polychytrium aggregatum TaxID=110093 RepID=UPI0022FE0F51|nr:uncharacterized protein BJ171DRAFT_221856 [Polychytrium aggregatum]KAI9197508.1 hypothetical protein BJ171DRAFT_221856 [Polychytrium aggregatum]
MPSLLPRRSLLHRNMKAISVLLVPALLAVSAICEHSHTPVLGGKCCSSSNSACVGNADYYACWKDIFLVCDESGHWQRQNTCGEECTQNPQYRQFCSYNTEVSGSYGHSIGDICEKGSPNICHDHQYLECQQNPNGEWVWIYQNDC